MSINKWLSSHWHSFQDNSNSVSYCRPGVSEASPAAPQSSLVVCLLRQKTAYQASETPDEGLVCLLGQKSQVDCGTTQSGPSYSLVAFTKPQKSFRSPQMPMSKESSGPHIQDQFIRKHSSALQICSWRRNLTSLSVCRWKVHSPYLLEKSSNPGEVLQEWWQTWFRVWTIGTQSSALQAPYTVATAPHRCFSVCFHDKWNSAAWPLKSEIQ